MPLVMSMVLKTTQYGCKHTFDIFAVCFNAIFKYYTKK